MPEMPSYPTGGPDGELVVDEGSCALWLEAERVSAEVDACGGGDVGGFDAGRCGRRAGGGEVSGGGDMEFGAEDGERVVQVEGVGVRAGERVGGV